MVKLQLSIKVDLENVTDLAPPSDDFDWNFKVKCTSCNEEHPRTVTVNKTEKSDQLLHKGASANFVWKCTNCKRQHSADFLPDAKFTPYTADSNGQFAPILVIDCRGLEFTGFEPNGIWRCVGVESGTVFSEVDLGEEWTDYDEKGGVPVSIMNIESKWTRA
ncbi:DUF866-domain-containing protein [Serendipita vermifera]|nr:DUF866-domain-containing protein [Serendipita vermifera]